MERRKVQRFKKRVTIKIDGKAAILNNISKDGLQVAYNGIPSNRQVIVTFTTNEDVVEVIGTVLWVNKSSFPFQPNVIGIKVMTPCPEFDRLVSS